MNKNRKGDRYALFLRNPEKNSHLLSFEEIEELDGVLGDEDEIDPLFGESEIDDIRLDDSDIEIEDEG